MFVLLRKSLTLMIQCSPTHHFNIWLHSNHVMSDITQNHGVRRQVLQLLVFSDYKRIFWNYSIGIFICRVHFQHAYSTFSEIDVFLFAAHFYVIFHLINLTLSNLCYFLLKYRSKYMQIKTLIFNHLSCIRLVRFLRFNSGSKNPP